MANEKRLIDANALWSDIMMLPHNGDMISSEEVEQEIKEAPTVDAVEVVRCKDCKHAVVHPFMADSQKLVCTKSVNWRAVEPGHFCSCGERRDNA